MTRPTAVLCPRATGRGSWRSALSKLQIVLLFAVMLPQISWAVAKPYRLLFVISDQWKDPRSFLVSGGGEFQTTVTMLKSWGVPFDILRLDHTLLDPNQFTDFSGRAKYGAILWDVPGDNLSANDRAIVEDAVLGLHISLIAMGNRVQQPFIQELLGIRYKNQHMNSAHPLVKGDSFLLRGVNSDLRTQGPDVRAMPRVQVELNGAEVLAAAADMPQVTERKISDDTRAIWIGGDIDQMLLYQ